MDRRTAIKTLGLAAIPFAIPAKAWTNNPLFLNNAVRASDFGNFTWGITTAAYQTEGAWDADGKNKSIWDTLAQRHGAIKDGSNANTACNFYNLYKSDIGLVKQLGFGAMRFSLSWPRIMQSDNKTVHQKGVDFYKRIIEACLECDIQPWPTLYHWDLPQTLEDKGGWLNRDIVGWFSDYTEVCAKHFGADVKNWIVLNEPLSFTLFGYGIGIHAPGHLGLGKFFKSAHHAALCQAEGGRVLRSLCPNAKIGTAFSCSPIDPAHAASERDIRAARRLDAVMNRMFTEPLLGLGYPVKEAPIMTRIEKYMAPGDEQKLTFDFDFWGIQNYFRVVINDNPFIPILKSTSVSPKKLGHPITEMNWEVYPEGLYRSVMQFSKYPVKEIFVTENGAAFKDVITDNRIRDTERQQFFNDNIVQLLKAKNDGANISGYFVWTLTDNFEWAEGYRPKFGLVHVDFASQQRLMKDSALWFANFLK